MAAHDCVDSGRGREHGFRGHSLMLRLTLEIVPFGDETLVRNIGTLEIARTTAHANPEDYTVYVWDKDGELTSIFTVEDHAYSDGAWDLCRRAVYELCPESNRG